MPAIVQRSRGRAKRGDRRRLRATGGPHRVRRVQSTRPWTAADAVALLGLAGVALIASWAFLHRHGIADADAMVMAAGLAHGLQPGVPFRESLLYGRLISPGFYSFFHVVLPRLVHDRAQIVDALNGIAAGAAGGTPPPPSLLFPAPLWRPARRPPPPGAELHPRGGGSAASRHTSPRARAPPV